MTMTQKRDLKQRWMTVSLVVLTFGIGFVGATSARAEQQVDMRDDSHVDGRLAACVLAGAGLGVAITGYALQFADLATLDGESYDPMTMMITGAVVFATGVLVAMLSRRDRGDTASQGTATLDPDRDGWPLVVAVEPGERPGLMVGIRGSF
jgi:hypothetical protein